MTVSMICNLSAIGFFEGNGKMEKLYIQRANEIVTFESVNPGSTQWMIELFRDEKLIDSREVNWNDANDCYVKMQAHGFQSIAKKVMNGKHDCSIFEAVNLIPC